MTAKIVIVSGADEDAVRKIWNMFFELGEYEENVIDNSKQTVSESYKLIQELLDDGRFRIGKKHIIHIPNAYGI